MGKKNKGKNNEILAMWRYYKGVVANVQFINFFIFEGIPLPFFYPYPSSFSFRGSHLLPGQDLDAISILFQIYFIQVTTTRFLESVKLQKSSFWCRSLGEYNLITGFVSAKAIGFQRGSI